MEADGEVGGISKTPTEVLQDRNNQPPEPSPGKEAQKSDPHRADLCSLTRMPSRQEYSDPFPPLLSSHKPGKRRKPTETHTAGGQVGATRGKNELCMKHQGHGTGHIHDWPEDLLLPESEQKGPETCRNVIRGQGKQRTGVKGRGG